MAMITQLVEASQAGGGRAFLDLVRAVEPYLRRWALEWVGGDTDEADDVVQDALVGLHKGLGELRSAAAAESWLWVLTRNAFLQRRRRERTHRRKARSFALEGQAGWSEPTPLERLIAKDTQERMSSAMGTLSGAQRQAVTLVAIRGMSAPQAARIAGVSPVTVRSNLCRGRAALRRALVDPGAIEGARAG